ncbi:VWA domain-containing protein [Desulfosporosinus youngiae]|uniref:Putative stress response protein, TerZ-and CABP1 n=1 Tax=Desulfosporosinus youngiae DSM 17734 TaxID=768710 RepID=H5Y3Y8_9FIRM|nr:VWA domain-containing protein [Desulfosporosinus youngiae]EHQ89526.1 putative stress response protein, TerZ- and CABP1 [Desulfosporosinus youngiae DSM 17734]
MNVTKGQKADVTKNRPDIKNLVVNLSWHVKDGGNPSHYDIDAAAFLLTMDGKTRADQDFIFYNNPAGGNGAVHHSLARDGGGEQIAIDLARLPQDICRIAFTITIHGAEAKGQNFGGIDQVRVAVLNKDTREVLLEYEVREQLMVETALVPAELYRHNGAWKFNAIGSGFKGGLEALCNNFGIEVELDKEAAPQEPLVVNLSKIDLLKKKVSAVLEKKKLINVLAKVGLVLDISGSMSKLYKGGTVQNLLDRITAVASHFDDDGMLDLWIFDHRFHRLPAVSEKTYEGYIEREILNKAKNGGFKGKIFGRNDEPPVIRDVIGFYTEEQEQRSSLPAFIVFISDGGINKNREIRKLITDAASLPLFWQFVGIGREDYGILEKLDTMAGRVVDNANFFALDDIDRISDEQLYERLLNEFPQWLKEAKLKKQI